VIYININELIKDTLKPLGIPIKFQKHTGRETTYITFFCYNEQGEVFADDVEIATGFYMQIDIWSKEDTESIKESTKELLKQAGFKKRTIHDAPYEPDTSTFHKVLRFFYYIEN